MIDRKPHYLYPLKSTDRPTRAIFLATRQFDLPAGNGVMAHFHRVGYALKCVTRRGETLRTQDRHTLIDPGEFWSWVSASIPAKSNVYLYSYKLVIALATLSAPTYLAELGFRPVLAYMGDPVTAFIWQRGKSKLFTLEHRNLFPGTLEAWQAYSQATPPQLDILDSEDAQMLELCRYEAEALRSLYVSYFEFLDEHRLGPFKITTSGAALAAFRYRFMGHKILAHTDTEGLALERDAYKGGRTEVFKTHLQNTRRYYLLDVNSMYGYVMREHLFPSIFWGVDYAPTLRTLERRLENYCIVARVNVTTDRPIFPYKRNGRTVFPVGAFDTTLTTPELRFALEQGWINTIKAMSHHYAMPLFRDYAAFFLALRERYRREGKTAWEQLCKLYVNSLYGKFGQRGYKQTDQGEGPPADFYLEPSLIAETGERLTLLHMAGRVIEISQTLEAYNSVPAIAAHITAYARMHLAKYLELCPPGSLYYCDTDSLIVDDRALPALTPFIDPHKPGYLKLEHESDFVHIFAPKDYEMAGRYRMKGISKAAIQTGENEYQQEIWHSFITLATEGLTDHYRTSLVKRRLIRVIDPDRVLPDGTVLPLVIDQQSPATPD